MYFWEVMGYIYSLLQLKLTIDVSFVGTVEGESFIFCPLSFFFVVADSSFLNKDIYFWNFIRYFSIIYVVHFKSFISKKYLKLLNTRATIN